MYAQGADDLAFQGEVVRFLRLRQAEVGDPDRALQVQQQVGRLDIAVQHPLSVGVRQRIGHLGTDPRHGHPVGPPVVRERARKRRRRLGR